jgi:hypothetical protein
LTVEGFSLLREMANSLLGKKGGWSGCRKASDTMILKIKRVKLISPLGSFQKFCHFFALPQFASSPSHTFKFLQQQSNLLETKGDK